VTHRQSARLHTTMSISHEPAERIFFDFQPLDGGAQRRISISDYHKEFCAPRLPCIQVSFSDMRMV
jgi:hypothetical protein